MPVNVRSITMINCKYCNHVMIPKEISFVGRRYEIVSCGYHKPTKVSFKLVKIGSFVGDRWVMSFGDYRLSYCTLSDRTLFQICRPGCESPSHQYYELIRKFDGELKMTPEQFPDKIKMLLAWS